MDDKLKDQIESIVTAIFASKEEDTKRKKTEDALHASADKLAAMKESLEVATQTNSTQLETISTLEEQVKLLMAEKASLEETFNKDLEAATAAKLTLETEFEKLNIEYSTLKTELLADKRMEELNKVGVVRENASVQRDRVKNMTEEDFAAYQEELVAIKKQVLATLASVKADDTSSVDDMSNNQFVPPANVDTAKSTQAALNLEMTPSTDLISKYRDLGQALADLSIKK